ncbi:MAG: nitroreductase family protein [Thermoplasmata archaeon]
MTDVTYRTGIGDKAALPVVDHKTCNLCGACVSVCMTGLTIKDGKVVYDPQASIGCVGCGQCMAACPTGSITVKGRRMSPECVIPLPTREKCASADQIEALLLRRRSVRNFERKAVEKGIIEHIIRIASSAPMGLPPSDVSVLVLEGKSLKEFREDMMRYFKGMSRFMSNRVMMALMRIFTKKADYEMMRDFVIPIIREYVSDWEKKIDSFLYDCPAVIIFHANPYAQKEDPVIAATYAMIAAESLGIGSCINGMIGPFLSRNKKLKRKYGIPEGNVVGIAIMLGYPTVEYHSALRRDFSSVKFLS